MKQINKSYLYDAQFFGSINFEYMYIAIEDRTIYYPDSEEDANMIIVFFTRKVLLVKKETTVRGIDTFVVVELSNGDEIKFYKN